MDLSLVAPSLYIMSAFYPPSPDDLMDWSGAVIFDLAGVVGEAFPLPDGARLVSAHMEDSPDVPVSFNALALDGALAIEGGENVICLCDAGRNRSALLAAAILKVQGLSTEAAIADVRAARARVLSPTGGALTNVSFVEWLRASD